MTRTLVSIFIIGAALALAAAQQNNSNQNMDGMQMPGHDMSHMLGHDMSNVPTQNEQDDSARTHAMNSMEGHHLDMGPHMKMTELRSLQSGRSRLSMPHAASWTDTRITMWR